MRSAALALALLLSASACASGAATSTHQASAPVTDVALAPPPTPPTAADAREDREQSNAALLSALAAESEAFDILGSNTIDSADLSGSLVGVPSSQGTGVGGLGGLGTRGTGAGGGGTLSGLGSGRGFSGPTTPDGPRAELALTTPTVRGGLDPDTVLRVLKRHAGSLRYCYQRQLQLNPQLAGTLDVTLTLGAQAR